MKTILLIAIMLSCTVANGAPIIKAQSITGNWNTPSSWDLNRVPQHGDTVVIGLGKTIIINSVINSLNGIVLKVYGTLKLSGGKLTLDDNSSITVFIGGNIQGTGSPSEQLRLGADKIWEGSQIAVTGPQLASRLTSGFIPFAQSVITLPVKFVAYSVAANNKDVLVQWSISEESGAYAYVVERSFDGSSWSAIGTVMASGNSNTLTNYTFMDRNILTRTVYYKVRQVDADGNFVYTPVRSIRPSATNKAEVRIASMTGNKVLLQFPVAISGPVKVQFIAMNGQVLGVQSIQQPAGQIILATNTLHKGACIVSVTDGKGLQVAGQVIL
jgi:hypothetical protein